MMMLMSVIKMELIILDCIFVKECFNSLLLLIKDIKNNIKNSNRPQNSSVVVADPII